MILMVPLEDGEPWPTLGPSVCQYIETNLVFGPGDLLGKRAVLDDEKRALIYSFYEVYPQGSRDANAKPIEGRRRFRRAGWSAQKGSAKTELADWIAAVELAPDSPVRTDRFSNGRPLGRPVIDPYIPMVAYTEEQASDLAFGGLVAILNESPIRHLFDIGQDRILRSDGKGKAVALAGAPSARDGARTTFSHKDETHRWITERLRRAHRTMIANLPKRLLADPWELETSTTYSPGENSVAEQTAEYAAQVASGQIRDSRLFFFHRQASDGYDVRDSDQLRAAVMEAAGPTAAWKDIEGICDLWQDPEADFEYLERVYLNRPVATASQAFDSAAWHRNTRKDYRVPAKALITLGFDGSIVDDDTALIATEVESGFQWPIKIWHPSERLPEIPREDVDAVVDAAFETYDVWRMNYDPSKFETQGARWEGKWPRRVVACPTVRVRWMATALKSYAGAIKSGECTNDGDPTLAHHIGAAQKMPIGIPDGDGSPLFLIQKDRPQSPNKIDGAMGGALSWEGRREALSAGAKPTQPKRGPRIHTS